MSGQDAREGAATAPGQAAVSPAAQAAYDAFWATPALGCESPSPLGREEPGIRSAWEAAAQAAVTAAAAAAQPAVHMAAGYAFGSAGDLDGLRTAAAAAQLAALPDPNHEPGLSECGCRQCDPQRHGLTPREQPAPELAAAIEQLRALAARWDAAADRNQRNGQSLLDQGDEYGSEGLAIAEALGACHTELTSLITQLEGQ